MMDEIELRIQQQEKKFEYLNLIVNEEVFFWGTYVEIGRSFLFKYLKLEKEIDFLAVKTRYHEEFGINSEVPDIENDFYTYVCRNNLGLYEEPRKVLYAVLNNASKHYQEINTNLSTISERIEEITKRRNNKELVEDDNFKFPILEHLKSKNQWAKNDLAEYLGDFKRIKEFIRSASGQKFIDLAYMYDAPYRYAFSPWDFRVGYPTDISNKFPLSASNDKAKIEELFFTDKEKFKQFLSDFIVEQKTCQSICEMIEKNHVLHEKQNIIKQCIGSYENKNLELFCHIAPSIMEGIFHSICLTIGANEYDMAGKGLKEKVDYIWHNKPFLLFDSYEYYSFRLRVIRNKVTHGGTITGDVQFLADLLLIDLYEVCRLLFSPFIPLNGKIDIIQDIVSGPDEESYVHFLEYVLVYQDIPVPDFYKTENLSEIIPNMLNRKEFWSYLKNQISKKDELVSNGIHKILRILKKDNDLKEIVDLLKEIDVKKTSEVDTYIFLQRLREINME
jgi:hypothetical protein